METRNPIKSAIMVQVGFILSTIFVIVAFFQGNFEILGLNLEVIYTVLALFISFPISLSLAYISSGLSAEYEPPIKIKGVINYFLVFIVLAPISEELVFRGLLEGYLLVTTTPIISILLPALLFSIVHISPFRDAPKEFLLLILISAFILSMVAGLLRFLSNSLIPSIITHSVFNLSGKIVEEFKR